VRCVNTVGEDRNMWGTAYIGVAPNASLGYAGLIAVTTPGGTTATIPLWIVDPPLGADLDYQTTDFVTGGPGDTVSVKVTVVNRGPNPQPYWGLNFHMLGARLLGQHGCAPGKLRGINWGCVHTSVTPVGATTTMTFDIAVDENTNGAVTLGGFDAEWFLSDPNHSNDNLVFELRAKTSGGSNNGGATRGGGGSNAGRAPGNTAADPTPSGTAAPSTSAGTEAAPSPVTTRTAQPSVPVLDLAAPPSSRSGGSLLLASTIAGAVPVLGFAAAGVVFFRRRRRVATTAGLAAPVATDAVAHEGTED
jgi:hypothetical protein